MNSLTVLPCGHCYEGLCKSNNGKSCAVCERDGVYVDGYFTCSGCHGTKVQCAEVTLYKIKQRKKFSLFKAISRYW